MYSHNQITYIHTSSQHMYKIYIHSALSIYNPQYTSCHHNSFISLDMRILSFIRNTFIHFTSDMNNLPTLIYLQLLGYHPKLSVENSHYTYHLYPKNILSSLLLTSTIGMHITNSLQTSSSILNSLHDSITSWNPQYRSHGYIMTIPTRFATHLNLVNNQTPLFPHNSLSLKRSKYYIISRLTSNPQIDLSTQMRLPLSWYNKPNTSISSLNHDNEPPR